MQPLKFTHTTFNTEVFIYAEQVFAVMFMPTFKSNVLMSIGGACVPVHGELTELQEQITIAKANNGQTINKELNDGTKTS